MSPNLEGIMLNRNANLSTRRPLLAEPSPAPLRHQNTDYYQQYAGAPRMGYVNHFDSETNSYLYQDPGRNKLVATESKNHSRKPESYRYFHPPKGLKRENELVFRFEPECSNGYIAENGHSQQGVFYQTGNLNGQLDHDQSDARQRIAPDGPFVFGVHSPSQFRILARQSSDDYDYAQVEGEIDKTVIKNDQTKNVNYCDKPSDGNGARVALSRMFQIRDDRSIRMRASKVDKRSMIGAKKNKIKCVLVGDGAVGKTSLITAYAQNKFCSDYAPTAYDNFNVEVEVDNRPMCVEICDTAGQDSMEELRALCYPGTDVLMLCFSVVRPETFRSVANRWVKAISSIKAPVILVGTQSDLAEDLNVLNTLRCRGEHVVTEEEAKILASTINATYIETSAKTRTHLKDAFDSAIQAALPVVYVEKKPIWKKLFCIY